MPRFRYFASFVAAAAVIVAASACASAPAGSGSGYLDTYLDDAVAKAGQEGFELVERYRTGALYHGDEGVLRIDLAGRTRYVITGACDLVCEDLDLRLASPSGEEIDRDLLEDSEPQVGVVIGHPSRHQPGSYSLTVKMQRCINPDPDRPGYANACRYGVLVFREK